MVWKKKRNLCYGPCTTANEKPIHTYLLVTEFDGRSVSYRPCFFQVNLWPACKGHELKRKKQGTVIYHNAPEKEASKMFITSLRN